MKQEQAKKQAIFEGICKEAIMEAKKRNGNMLDTALLENIRGELAVKVNSPSWFFELEKASAKQEGHALHYMRILHMPDRQITVNPVMYRLMQYSMNTQTLYKVSTRATQTALRDMAGHTAKYSRTPDKAHKVSMQSGGRMAVLQKRLYALAMAKKQLTMDRNEIDKRIQETLQADRDANNSAYYTMQENAGELDFLNIEKPSMAGYGTLKSSLPLEIDEAAEAIQEGTLAMLEGMAGLQWDEKTGTYRQDKPIKGHALYNACRAKSKSYLAKQGTYKANNLPTAWNDELERQTRIAKALAGIAYDMDDADKAQYNLKRYSEGLSARQKEALALIVQGLNGRQIADRLGIAQQNASELIKRVRIAVFANLQALEKETARQYMGTMFPPYVAPMVHPVNVPPMAHTENELHGLYETMQEEARQELYNDIHAYANKYRALHPIAPVAPVAPDMTYAKARDAWYVGYCTRHDIKPDMPVSSIPWYVYFTSMGEGEKVYASHASPACLAWLERWHIKYKAIEAINAKKAIEKYNEKAMLE
jgi:DNA-binding CsgD family transcriptional regulator